MNELIQVGAHTYYIDCPSRIGFYQYNEDDVFVIDTGSFEKMGKKISDVCIEKGWHLKGIINTHFHADHIAGNAYLQKKYDCPAYAYGPDQVFVEHTTLESSFLFGGFPHKGLLHRALYAKPSKCFPIEEASLPEGLSYFPLHGHSNGMIGVRTDDDIVFISDTLASKEVIQKYRIIYNYDIKTTLETLHELKNINASLFVSAHVEPLTCVDELADYNISVIHDIATLITSLCETPLTFEDIIKKLFDHYELTLNEIQHALIGSMVRSYVSYLIDEGILYTFIENNMFFIHKK